MNIKKIIQAYDTHSDGVQSRIITGGIPFIPGKDIFKKTDFLKKNMDDIRKFIFLKPRGNKNLSGLIVTEPTVKAAHLAAIFIDESGYDNCYSEDLVSAFTVIAETGMININNKTTELILETQFGLFKGIITYEDESVKNINIMCPKECVLRSKNNTPIDGTIIIGCRAFITGMHMFLLDSEDKICC